MVHTLLETAAVQVRDSKRKTVSLDKKEQKKNCKLNEDRH